MTVRVPAPDVDERTAQALLQRLRAMAPHYTPDWAAKDSDDPGIALLSAFAFLSAGLINRLNRAPDRNFFAFLQMLGIRLLPATPASGPIRFLVANGAAGTIDVPENTQMTASSVGQPPPLPFITNENLRVVAANLAALIAVDPLRDTIYLPPPGFLGLRSVTSPLPPLTIQAFSAAGSNAVQLDFTEQLKPGDILRITQPMTGAGTANCADSAAANAVTIDFAAVHGVQGTVVTVEDPLPRDYSPGTLVEKVTQFSLLSGKDVQQHVLFIGHNDFFNVKSAATFTLDVTQAPGAIPASIPFQVAWEFWGVTKTSTEAGWQSFEAADGTSGLTASGPIELQKPEGEIKPTTIDGVQNRWIRARLKNPLPAIPPPVVSHVESIKLRVSSSAKGIPLDLAFNNDTPLSLNPPFAPFGFEPRTFDRFYLASAEAFSKPGAAVKLELAVDVSELLGAPSAISTSGNVRVFAHGTGGVLTEFPIDPLASTQTQPAQEHGQPAAGTKVSAGSIPAAVSDPPGNAGVFVKADDGNIYVRWMQGTNSAQWFNLQSPPGSKLNFDPAAVYLQPYWQVFAVKDQKLYSRSVIPGSGGTAGNWTAVGSADFLANSTPFAIASSSELRVVIFDTKGETHIWDGTTWNDVTPQNNGVPDPRFLAAKDSRPWAQLFGTIPVNVRVFLRNQANQLAVVDYATATRTVTVDVWGSPANLTLQSSPVAYADDPADISTVHVCVTASNNTLAEASFDSTSTPPASWISRTPSFDATLNQDPFLLAYTTSAGGKKFFSVLSTSDKNLLLEFRSAPGALTSGDLRAGPLEFFPLETATDLSGGQFYVAILSGPDKATLFAILDGAANTTYARIKGVLSQPAAKNTKYQLHMEIESDQVAAADVKHVTLKAGTAAVQGEYILVGAPNPQARTITNVHGDTATVDRDWDTVPQLGDPYSLLQAQGSQQKAQDRAAHTVILDITASSSDGEYQDRYLRVLPGAPNEPLPVKIKQYFGADHAALLATPPSAGPLQGTPYEIAFTPVTEAWHEFQDVDQSNLRPQLSWEYWNGTGWVSLPGVSDETANLLVAGSIQFTLPADVAQTQVAGQKNYWIRARIVGGDYGHETFSVTTSNTSDNPPASRAAAAASGSSAQTTTQTFSISKSGIRPPSIQSLTVSYIVSQDQLPQKCMTFNNREWRDETAANIVQHKFFVPFAPVPDAGPTLYLGFDQPFEGGPVRIYFAAQELAVDETNPPKLDWQYAADNDWKAIVDADDATRAFTAPKRASFSVDNDWQQRSMFNQQLSWLRARLVQGKWIQSPVFSGVFPNTCRAIQARTFKQEILGSGDETPDQMFHFAHVPVFDGEEVRVREVLTDDETAALIKAAGPDSVFVTLDNQGKPLETWVRWKEVIELYDSDGNARVYRLDRADGEIQFGDGVHGKRLPIGGDNVVAFFYRAGGGSQGNVAAEQIDTLATAIAGIQSATNPDAFGGGSDKADPEQMLVFGPAQISNRGRAVTPNDFETLAIEASRQVRKAHCQSNTNNSQQPEAAWVSVYIVPESTDPLPMPSLSVRRAVTAYIQERAVATVADRQHIFVGPPDYVVVSVNTTVFAVSLDVIGTVEQAVHRTLQTFLHPLTGGPEGQGWDFGRQLVVSDLYVQLQDIDGVSHVATITLNFNGQTSTDIVPVGLSQLIAGGTHNIRMAVEGGN